MKNWTQDQTEKWLTENPLPPDFEWRGSRVLPQYRLHKGYGFWLRTTPYHRGLFAAVHDVLFQRTLREIEFPDVVELPEILKRQEEMEKAQMNLFPADDADQRG